LRVALARPAGYKDEFNVMPVRPGSPTVPAAVPWSTVPDVRQGRVRAATRSVADPL